MHQKVVTLIDTLYIGFLVEQVRHGNQQAFETLHDMFHRSVYKAAQYRVGEEHAADVTQETFYRAYRYLRTLRNSEQFGPWLMRIARNVSRDWLRERGRIQDNEKFDVDELAHVLVDQGALTLEAKLDLAMILESVPQNFVHFIDLHYLRGLTAPEISLATGLSVSTVKWRIHRGLELCRLAAVKRQGRFSDPEKE